MECFIVFTTLADLFKDMQFQNIKYNYKVKSSGDIRLKRVLQISHYLFDKSLQHLNDLSSESYYKGS